MLVQVRYGRGILWTLVRERCRNRPELRDISPVPSMGQRATVQYSGGEASYSQHSAFCTKGPCCSNESTRLETFHIKYSSRRALSSHRGVGVKPFTTPFLPFTAIGRLRGVERTCCRLSQFRAPPSSRNSRRCTEATRSRRARPTKTRVKHPASVAARRQLRQMELMAPVASSGRRRRTHHGSSLYHLRLSMTTRKPHTRAAEPGSTAVCASSSTWMATSPCMFSCPCPWMPPGAPRLNDAPWNCPRCVLTVASACML